MMLGEGVEVPRVAKPFGCSLAKDAKGPGAMFHV